MVVTQVQFSQIHCIYKRNRLDICNVITFQAQVSQILKIYMFDIIKDLTHLGIIEVEFRYFDFVYHFEQLFPFVLSLVGTLDIPCAVFKNFSLFIF